MQGEEKSFFIIITAFFSEIADWLNNSIIIKLLFQVAPIIWGFIIQAWRPNFFNVDGSLNRFGFWGALILTCISILIMFVTALQSKKDREIKEKYNIEAESYAGEIELRKTITEAECILEERRNNKLRDWLEKNIHQKNTLLQFVEYAKNPKEGIRATLDGLRECFTQISGVSKSNIYISAAISVINQDNDNEQSKWEWLISPPHEGTASLDALINKTNHSAFNVVVQGTPFFYANDKEDAAKNCQYYFDNRDISYGKVGSIICCEFTEFIGQFKIRMIISISTYGEKIIKTEDENSEDRTKSIYEERIRAIVLKQFEGEIKDDLLWYAINHFKILN